MVYRWLVHPTVASVPSLIIALVQSTFMRATISYLRGFSGGHPIQSTTYIRPIIRPVTPIVPKPLNSATLLFS